MQLKGNHTLWQCHCQSIIKTQMTTNSFEGFFTCSPFCFYVDCRQFYWLQHTLFINGRRKPPNYKGTTSSFLSGPNFTCSLRLQPWTHRPIYSHSHSATCWTLEMTFNPFLHCPKHGQLIDVYAIIEHGAGCAARPDSNFPFAKSWTMKNLLFQTPPRLFDRFAPNFACSICGPSWQKIYQKNFDSP